MAFKSTVLVLGTKKNALLLGALFAVLPCVGAHAQEKEKEKEKEKVGLTYTVGAEVVSNYIWRGIQVAGLGVQPELFVGYGGAYIDLWGSVNAYDWTFTEPHPITKSPLFPEVDLSVGFARWGLDVKFIAMYYFTGWENYTQEWRLKYRISDKIPLHVLWCTRTFGRDSYYESDSQPQKRAYSSYLEVGYEWYLPYNMHLELNLGMTPWKSFYTCYQDNFAVVDIDTKLTRYWKIKEHLCLSAYAHLMVNPYDISRMRRGESREEYQPRNLGQQFLWNIGFGVHFR